MNGTGYDCYFTASRKSPMKYVDEYRGEAEAQRFVRAIQTP